MRLFVAIELGEDVIAAAARVIDALRRRVQTVAPSARLTWITPERMHLTVRFIGHVDDDRAAAIQQALAVAIPVAPFDLWIERLGAFPPTRAPRVLAVEREVTARLTPLGIAPEDRAYSPHLTLARVKEPGGLRAKDLFDGIADRALGVARIDAITLFESRLSPKGPTYVRLVRTPLA